MFSFGLRCPRAFVSSRASRCPEQCNGTCDVHVRFQSYNAARYHRRWLARRGSRCIEVQPNLGAVQSEFAALCSSSRAWRVLAVQPDSFLLEMHDELSVDSLLQFMSMVASPSKRRALIAAFGEEVNFGGGFRVEGLGLILCSFPQEVLPPTIWNTGRSSGRSWLLSALILLTALLLFVLCYLLLHSSFLSHILLLVFVGGLLFELIWSSIVSKLGF